MHTAIMPQHQEALAPQMAMSGTHSTFRVHLAADLKHWNHNETGSLKTVSHCNFNFSDNIPKTAWCVWKYQMLS
jgi:hypothetical protein